MDSEYFLPVVLLASAGDDFTSGILGDTEMITETESYISVPEEIISDETSDIETYVNVGVVDELLTDYVVQSVGMGFAFASVFVLLTFGVFKAFSFLHIKY